MKQTLFMAAVTAFGMVGAMAVEPFIGVAVYYFFAVLRPQYLWLWALPKDVGWSGYVAWTTLLATFLMTMNPGDAGSPAPGQRFAFAHKAYFAFGAWICLTYFTSLNQNVAWFWFQEYLKIFIMFGVATLAINSLRQIWSIYLAATAALIYIAYEMNYLYFTAGRLDIYHNGYGGLDNNGAALMLAMGVPLSIYAWEGTRRIWRWVFIAGIPLLMHAVLMSYSRGAMLSLIVVTPFLLLRSKKKFQFTLLVVLLSITVPYLAGKEIRDRFFSVQQYEADESAKARFDSWGAAIKIANDYPIFGVGIRNANLISYKYGADVEGRTIHSQYLQTMADSGYVGLTLYLLTLISVAIATIRARRFLKKRTDPESERARSMLSGIEGALIVFCFGASFLSLEVFELPYLVGLLGAQMYLLTSIRMSPAPVPVYQSPLFAAPSQRAT